MARSNWLLWPTNTADIRRQLREATKDFEVVNEHFRQLMVDAKKTPNVIKGCTQPYIEDLLTNILTPKLEECQKASGTLDLTVMADTAGHSGTL